VVGLNRFKRVYINRLETSGFRVAYGIEITSSNIGEAGLQQQFFETGVVVNELVLGNLLESWFIASILVCK
jgi:hypothetical protein